MARYTESWPTTGNPTAVAEDLTWSQVTGTTHLNVSSAGVLTGTGNIADNERIRAASDTEAPDQYATLVVSAVDAASQRGVGLCLRYSSSADTCYACQIRSDTSPDQFQLVRFSGGISNTITSFTSAGADFSVPFTLRFEVAGSQLRVLVNGSLVGSANDTNLAAGTRGGLWLTNPNSIVTVGAFEYGDLREGRIVTSTAAVQRAASW
ncbi:hypothetical protein [Frankia sp. AgW1.1]|uniref:hypothetical protein n=1 Tax=Frankia sp. AgW1.1 TaxID=1836971 RepID=UPI0019347FC4|nr:hypothetical protein [Frankia sp. AgW1.1]MBL7494471.1 hypothetical protein [Frankia sp. AgW1.1]